MTTETHSKTFTTLDAIRRRILTGAAEAYCYGPLRREKEPGAGWDDAFSVERIAEKFSRQRHDEIAKENKWMTPSANLDVYEMSLDELVSLGFGLWDESGLRLVPLWAMPFLPPELVLTSICGDTETVAEADLDHRGGMAAFGFVPTVTGAQA